MKSLVLNGDQLTLDDAVSALHGGGTLKVSAEARQRVKAVRSSIDKAVRDKK